MNPLSIIFLLLALSLNGCVGHKDVCLEANQKECDGL